MSDRTATVWLWVLALVLPVGALLQPRLFPSRSALPIVPISVTTPLVIITVPGLRADRVHSFGYARETTPHLDSLAESSVSFLRHYASSNLAALSVASLFDGRTPPTDHWLSGKLPTANRFNLPQRLLNSGYHTMSVVADPELQDRGLFRGLSQNTRLDPEVGAAGVFEVALSMIDERPDQRFMLWVDLPDLLAPYGGADFDPRRFAPDMPEHFGATEAPFQHIPPRVQQERGWGRREQDWLSDRYDAALFELDAALGAFLSALDERMLLANATLLVMGTRGELITEEPTRLATFGVDLYETSVHTPAVLHLPAAAQRGRRITEPVDCTRLSATLLQHMLRFGRFARFPKECQVPLLDEMRTPGHDVAAAFSVGPHRRIHPVSGVRLEPLLGQSLRVAHYLLVADLNQSRGAELSTVEGVPVPPGTPPLGAGKAVLNTLLALSMKYTERCAP